MEKTLTKSSRLLPLMILSFVLSLGLFYTSIAEATGSVQPPGTQLAYFIGFHSYPGGYYRHHNVYYGNRYRHNNYYWRNWGHRRGCSKSCVVDRRSGAIIRCYRRC